MSGVKTFRDAIRSSDFAVSAEIYLRPETDADGIRQQAEILRDVVHGILLTDNQFGQVHMSTIAAASILLDYGVDPIVQLTSRNRNRIALLSDLLGAAAIGVTSLLLVAGERAPKEFQPRPKPVLDLNAKDLIRTADTIRQDEKLAHYPDFLIGGLVTPVLPKPDWEAEQLREKVAAGARFVQTHICMDTGLLRKYMGHLVKNRLTHGTSVIVAVAVPESADDARWLKENRPNVMLPDDLVARLENSARPREEGISICAEIIRALRGIPGIAGVNVMATRDLAVIPEVLRAAGLDD